MSSVDKPTRHLLFTGNIDPEKAADEYRERVIGRYRAAWIRV